MDVTPGSKGLVMCPRPQTAGTVPPGTVHNDLTPIPNPIKKGGLNYFTQVCDVCFLICARIHETRKIPYSGIPGIHLFTHASLIEVGISDKVSDIRYAGSYRNK
jgi:hypothetical protein